jgi:hypothetical protein
MPALLLLTGCASFPEDVRELPVGAGPFELEATPFVPQERYQCGPAALTTVLLASGADVALDDIVDRVYLPGRKGSLQFELLAAARSEGRLPYLIDGTLSAIRTELAAGRPVLVMQNLSIAVMPRWHYAVVVGIDPDRDRVILRSGTERRHMTSIRTFLYTWRRSDYWAFVVLPPDTVPAAVDKTRYFDAIAALEQAGQLESAAIAWRTALSTWPGDTIATFGLGNVYLAGGQYADAEQVYRELLAQDEGMVVARNNLALALADQGEFDAALEEIGKALDQARGSDLADELKDTERTIRDMRGGN